MVVEFRASLPKTPIGKVLKRELREPSVGAPTTDAVP
jgi:acyl-CoA synthetase (AMP-forming)/AMP-acid ligase II